MENSINGKKQREEENPSKNHSRRGKQGTKSKETNLKIQEEREIEKNFNNIFLKEEKTNGKRTRKINADEEES